MVIVGNAFERERQLAARAPLQIMWDRRELDAILSVYGRQVARGAWRDYGIDARGDRAVFSIFRRSSEVPIYRVEKIPSLRARQGQYAVVNMGGQVLKRGHDLQKVLRVLDKGRGKDDAKLRIV